MRQRNFIKAAKTLNVPTVLVGTRYQRGNGGRADDLSHMVDTVLFLEGEKNTGTRILRSLKTASGRVDEVGHFCDAGGGMEEIKNPSKIFLTKSNNAPGSVLVANLEGTRAFFG